MKIVYLMSFILCILLFSLPVIAIHRSVTIPLPENEQTVQQTNSESNISPESSGDSVDNRIVKISVEGEIIEMTLENYLFGVVAAEMPASFESEALKAQAVAARTYTLYRTKTNLPEPHAGAIACDDPNCCQAYITAEKLKENWGNNYNEYSAKVMDAVQSTSGIALIYNEEPILAAFHSSSGGLTESSQNVWASALPYLVNVESPENASNVPNYYSTVILSTDEFCQTFLSHHPEALFPSDNTSDWFTDIIYTDGGRVKSAVVGGISCSGTDLRSIFSLRSAAFTLEITSDSVIFTTVGYGHGVGMSQYGANVLAAQGWSFDDILTHYYVGCIPVKYL